MSTDDPNKGCDCLTLNRQMVKDHYREQAGEDITVEIGNLAIVFGATTNEQVYSPVHVRGSKKPFNTKKGRTINLFYNYCPWCGQKISDERKLS